MFPSRLRATGRVAINSLITFSSAATSIVYLNVNNPITVVSGQNMSGLAWLISGVQSNGSSYAPYALGIVRSVKIEIFAKTVATPTGPTGALVTMFPLPPSSSSTTLSLTNAEEQFGRSSIIELPLSYDTDAHSKPLITKSYKLWELFGVSETVYMSGTTTYAFGQVGLIGTQMACAILTGTESAVADATLAVRLNTIVTLEVEFFNRNDLIVSAPHA